MVPLLARLRTDYEQLTLPLGQVCVRLGVSANSLTYLSLGLSVLTGYLLARSLFLWAVMTLLLVGLADVLDGATARAAGTAGPYGMVLDHVTDRYAEFFILGGLIFSGRVAAGWVLFALFGMIMASYVRAKAESTGALASCNVGFAGRQEKLALLILGLIIQPFLLGLPVLEWALIAIGIASHTTAVQRLLYTRRQLVTAQPPTDIQQGSGLLG